VEGATLTIAVVGAVTGVLGLGWQIYTWFQERRPKVRVKLATAYLTGPNLKVLSLTVLNDYAIRVNSTGVVAQDGSRNDLVFLRQIPGASLPGAVPAHDEGLSFLEIDAAEQAGISVFRPLTAWANVASIGRVESESTTLMRR
jgi:hypothetical protein